MMMSENGTTPRNSLLIIIIRAHQRLMISRAVELTWVGWNVRRSSVSSGQPSVANGHSADENQVSSTSGSRSSSLPPQDGQLVGSCSSTMVSPHEQYQTGSWWPHQSWRDTHHGRIASIQWKKMRSAPFGWKRT